MAVESVKDNSAVTIDPKSIRYSVSVLKADSIISGGLFLTRSQRIVAGNGAVTWIDAPKQPGVVASKSVELPTTTDMIAAVNGLLALLPAILTKLGVTGAIGDVKLTLNGRLTAACSLDLSATIMLKREGIWSIKSIPSLNSFLGANQELIAPVQAAWGALDAAVNAANASEGWL